MALLVNWSNNVCSVVLLVYSSTLFEKNLRWMTKNYFSQAVRQSVHNLCQFISKRFVGAQNCKLVKSWFSDNDCNFLLRLKSLSQSELFELGIFGKVSKSSRNYHASMKYSYLLVKSDLCLLSFVCKKIILVLDGLSSSKKIFLIESSTIDHSWFGWVKLWLETGAASSGRKQAAAVGKYHRWSCKIVVEWKILESYVWRSLESWVWIMMLLYSTHNNNALQCWVKIESNYLIR